MVNIVSAYYKNEDMTREFLDNLADKLPIRSHLILVNAGSEPIEHRVITERIDLEENKSFSNSMNAGLKRSYAADYVIVIGNDVFPLSSTWIDDLISVVEDSRAMLVAPRNNVETTPSFTEENDIYGFTKFSPAVCWLMPQSTLRNIGLFDEQFLIGTYEDNDYCRRVENVGGKIAIAKNVFVDHLLSRTMGLFDAPRVMEENAQRYREKWPG